MIYTSAVWGPGLGRAFGQISNQPTSRTGCAGRASPTSPRSATTQPSPVSPTTSAAKPTTARASERAFLMTTLLASGSERSLPVPYADKNDHELSLTPTRARPSWRSLDALYRVAYALSGSRHDAEDLVQETFAQVLKRPRVVRREHELRYLLRALRNTY